MGSRIDWQKHGQSKHIRTWFQRKEYHNTGNKLVGLSEEKKAIKS
jgi:hypothetical protein